MSLIQCFQEWGARRRYFAELAGLVIPALQAEVVGGIQGETPVDLEALINGVAMRFPPRIQPLVRRLWREFVAVLRIGIQTAIVANQDEVEIRHGKMGMHFSELSDSRTILQDAELSPVAPDPPRTKEEAEKRFLMEIWLQELRARVPRLYSQAVCWGLLALVALAVEASLVYLSLRPFFDGVEGADSHLLPVQASAITTGIMLAAHLACASSRTAYRVSAGLVLAASAFGLVYLRFGLLGISGSGAEEGSREMLCLFILMWLSTIAFAVMAAQMLRAGIKRFKHAETKREEMLGVVIAIQARLAAEDLTEALKGQHKLAVHRQVIERVGVARQDGRYHEQAIRSEQAELRRFLQRAIERTAWQLRPLIQGMAHQLARWYVRPEEVPYETVESDYVQGEVVDSVA